MKHQAIARIYDKSGGVAGAAFLVDERRLLTCAHVVAEATGLSREALASAGVTVSLDFPLPETETLLATVSLPDAAQDVALLTLAEPLAAPRPVQLIAATAVARGDEWQAYGFPAGFDAGQLAEGHIQGEVGGEQWQLAGSGPGDYAISQGYSGAPIYDFAAGGYVGMVRVADRRDGQQSAFALTVALLQRLLPDLIVGQPLTAAQLAERATGRQYQKAVLESLRGEVAGLAQRFVKLTLIVPTDTGWQQSVNKADHFDDLATLQAAQSNKALILLGDPGSGKTVLLQHLQLNLTEAGLAEPAPIYCFRLRLSQFQDRTLTPAAWLARRWQRYPGMPALSALLQSGRLILLLDGLNELPHKDMQEYRQRLSAWAAFLDSFPTAGRVIFSCRTLDYSSILAESSATPVQQVQVQPLNDEQIQSFLQKHRPEVAANIWAQLEADEQQRTLLTNPFFLNLAAQVAEPESGKLPVGRAGLITYFVRQALQRELSGRENRLLADSTLLAEGDKRQIEQERWGRSPYALPERGLLIPSLTRLAYQMQVEAVGHVSWEYEQVATLLGAEMSQAVVDVGVQMTMLAEEEVEQGTVLRFYHQLLQEYFAARYVTVRPEPRLAQTPLLAGEVSPTFVEEVARLGERKTQVSALEQSGWEESMLMAAAMSREPEEFLAGLQANNPLLAVRAGLNEAVSLTPEARQRWQEAAVAMLADERYDIRARILAASYLGEDDPRFAHRQGPDGPYRLPDYVTVPSGEYWLGTPEGEPGWSGERPPLSGKSGRVCDFPLSVDESGIPLLYGEWGV